MSCGLTLRGYNRVDVEGSTFEIEIPNQNPEENSIVNIKEIKLDKGEEDVHIDR